VNVTRITPLRKRNSPIVEIHYDRRRDGDMRPRAGTRSIRQRGESRGEALVVSFAYMAR